MKNCKRGAATGCGWLMALLLSGLLAACGGGGGGGSSGGSGGGGGGGGGPASVVPGTAGSPGAAATNPTVISANPSNGALNVPTSLNTTGGTVTGTPVSATFNEAMQSATIVSPALTFTLKQTISGVNEPGTVTINAANTIATFTPTAGALAINTSYTATMTIDAKNAGGTAMPNPVSWSFTTKNALYTGQAPIALGATQPYGVLSNTSVTLGGGPASTTGFRVSGDVGISPAGACTGCDNTTVTGLINIGAAADGAMLALTDAYNEAIGRSSSLCTLIAAGDLTANPPAGCGGAANGTYAPGLYWIGSSMAIPAGGTITLDAQNDPNAVFIFQADTTINSIGGNTHVVLANLAQAKNVFWVSKTSATIGGVASDFAGTVIALSAATVNTGTSLAGRVLARGAAVTVQDNSLVTVPAP